MYGGRLYKPAAVCPGHFLPKTNEIRPGSVRIGQTNSSQNLVFLKNFAGVTY